MQILQIIDSLELNGGSTMFLELVSAMNKYLIDCEILPFVVSKTGQIGRTHLSDIDLANSYGISNLQVMDYLSFDKMSSAFNDAVIFHHVLGHTKNIIFNNSCRYYLVNHTATNIHRLAKFKCNGIISVCKYFANLLKNKTRLNSKIILNGCEYYYNNQEKNTDKFIIGCCQRVVPSKFKTNGKNFPSNIVRHVIGPCSSSVKSNQCVFFGPIFEKNKKIEHIRLFDLYLHDTSIPEGASMALLESLSNGVPVLASSVGGGTAELIIPGVNGYLYRNEKELYNLICRLSENKDEYKQLKQSTLDDFQNRLHIKHSIEKYKKIIYE